MLTYNLIRVYVKNISMIDYLIEEDFYCSTNESLITVSDKKLKVIFRIDNHNNLEVRQPEKFNAFINGEK